MKKLASSANDSFANESGQPVDNKKYDKLTNDVPTTDLKKGLDQASNCFEYAVFDAIEPIIAT